MWPKTVKMQLATDNTKREFNLEITRRFLSITALIIVLILFVLFIVVAMGIARINYNEIQDEGIDFENGFIILAAGTVGGLFLIGAAYSAIEIVSFVNYTEMRINSKRILKRIELRARSDNHSEEIPPHISSDLDELNSCMLRYVRGFKGKYRAYDFSASQLLRTTDLAFACMSESVNMRGIRKDEMMPFRQAANVSQSSTAKPNEFPVAELQVLDWVIDIDRLLFGTTSKESKGSRVSRLEFFLDGTITHFEKLWKEQGRFDKLRIRIDEYYNRQESAAMEWSLRWIDASRQIVIGAVLLVLGYMLGLKS